MNRFTEGEKDLLFYNYGVNRGKITEEDDYETAEVEVALKIKIKALDPNSKCYRVKIGNMVEHLYLGMSIDEILESIKNGGIDC